MENQMKLAAKQQFKKYGRIAAIVLVALALLGGYFWLRQHDLFYIFSSQEALRDYMEGFGTTGPIAFFVLQVLQVVIAPIPGNITTVVGAMLFGFWKSFLISSAAMILASLACFGIGRLLGKSLIKRILKPATVDKYLNTMAKEKEYMIYIFFLVPFLPDDMICIIAGLTAMSWGYFSLATILCRPWGVLASAAVGTGALNFSIWGYVALGLLIIAISYITIKYGDKINDKTVHWAKSTSWLPHWRKNRKRKNKSRRGTFLLNKNQH